MKHHIRFFLSPEHRFDCLACGRCCKTTAISLTPAEAERLASRPPIQGVGPTTQKYKGGFGTGYRLFPRKDGSCPFLREDQLCDIHGQEGEGEKPLACRLFPFSFLQVPGGFNLTLRFSCPAVAAGLGKPLQGREEFLGGLVSELMEKVGVRKIGDSIPFDATRLISYADASKIVKHELALLDTRELPFLFRVAAVVEFMELVAASSISANSRYRYWQGLRDGLVSRFKSAPVVSRTPPGSMDRLFFRQTAFGLAGTFEPSWLRKSL
ncbi:MAG: YkgJ family cysteine cluster protein, partial [Planctomycetota bacterium]